MPSALVDSAHPPSWPNDVSIGPTTPPGSVRVVAWSDPSVPEEIDARSSYVEMFWLPALGPSAIWLLRRLADETELHPEGATIDLDHLALCLGLGTFSSRHAPLKRALQRCIRFGVSRWVAPNVLEVRRHLPQVPRRQLLRYPLSLQAEHRHWVNALREADDSTLVRRRARLLALDFVALCMDLACIERQLLRRGVHPAIAFEAAQWAWSAPGHHDDDDNLVDRPSSRTEPRAMPLRSSTKPEPGALWGGGPLNGRSWAESSDTQ